MISWQPLQFSDCDRLLHWRNQPHVADFQYSDHVISTSEHRAWLQRTLLRSDCQYWVTSYDTKPIGLAGLIKIEPDNKKGLFVLYIGELGFEGKGIGTWMARSVLKYAFESMKLNKVYVEVFEDNNAALALYRKVGFQQEGKLVDHVYKQGEPRTVLYMSIFSNWLYGNLRQGY